jgi:hypothetical protein
MSISLETLRPGQTVTYYEGSSLAHDRQTTAKRRNPSLELADTVWELALASKVDLLQRRLADGTFAYLAIKRRSIDRKPVSPLQTEANARRRAREA